MASRHSKFSTKSSQTNVLYRAKTQNEINLKQLIQKRSEIEIKLSNNDTNTQIKKIQKELSQIKKSDTLTPEILHRLIERVEIKADGTARVFYRFSFPSAINYRNVSNTQHSTCAVCGNISTG
jgi:site-specific DNA recombinase